MASRYYGLNNDAFISQEKVATGTSTQSTDVEVRIDTTKSWSRIELQIALEAIIRRLNSGTDDLNVI